MQTVERRRGNPMGLLSNLISFGAGYALGAQKGYEPIRSASRRAGSAISDRIPMLSSSLRGDEVVDVREVRDVMTPAPETIEATAKLPEAARVMREYDIGDVVVTEQGRPVGILTDRDIAVRGFTTGADPSWTSVRELIRGDLVTIAPNEAVQEAMRLMKDRDIRRLPVVERDRVIGVVSLGDLAGLPGAETVLADVSEAPPNA
jgi:CBS domain-containing protein